MHYRLPPNDPRFLDLTEEDMLRDLFVIRYHQHFARLANDPHYAAEQASLDPAVRNRFDRLQQALEEDDTLGEMARAHHRQQAVVRRERTAEGPHADQEPEGGFRTIMLGGGTR